MVVGEPPRSVHLSLKRHLGVKLRRFKTWGLVLTLILNLSCPAMVHAAGSKKITCAGLLAKTGQVVTWPVRAMKSGFKAFWAERLQQGRIRWWLAPRYHLKDFNKRAWFNPVELPVELANYYTSRAWGYPILRKPSGWVSFPVINALWVLPFIWLQAATDHWDIEALENNLREDRYGAAYVADWIGQEQLTLLEGTKLLFNAQQRFAYALEPLRLRAQKFLDLGLWTEQQFEIASQILTDLVKQNTLSELMRDTALREKLAADPRFEKLQSSLTGETDFTLELWIQPEVQLHGRTDAEWLALVFSEIRRTSLSQTQKLGLKSIEENNIALDFNLPLTTLALMAAKTINDPAQIEAKIEHATQVSIPVDSEFIYRVDFPIFQSVQTLNELSGAREFDSEMDLWALIYGGDPRFAGILDLLKSGDASEFAVLFEVSGRLQDLNSVYSLHEKSGADPQPEEFCPLIYGGAGQQPNTYFVALQALHENPWQAVFADINYDSLVEASRATSKLEFDQAIQRGDLRTQQTLQKMESGETSPVTVSPCLY